MSQGVLVVGPRVETDKGVEGTVPVDDNSAAAVNVDNADTPIGGVCDICC